MALLTELLDDDSAGMDYSYYASAPPPQAFPPFFGHGLPDAQHPQPGATGADQLNFQDAAPVVRFTPLPQCPLGWCCSSLQGE